MAVYFHIQKGTDLAQLKVLGVGGHAQKPYPRTTFMGGSP